MFVDSEGTSKLRYTLFPRGKLVTVVGARLTLASSSLEYAEK